MPLASYQSTEAALSELRVALSDEATRLDLCLSLVRKSTREELLRVGGRWDTLAGRYLDPDPPGLRAFTLLVNENQVATVEKFRDWLAARISGGPRKRLLITGGNRRGGKSWIITALACATAVALPEAIIWLVSPTLKKRDEVERYIKAHTAPNWRSYGARDLRFRFVNGATITSITGEDAEAIKQGEADLVCYNEPQMMHQDVLTYGAPAIIDTGGLLLFAGNPSRRRKGVWFTRLLRAVEEGKYEGGEVCRLDARDNPDIDAAARSDIGRLMNLVDPEAARADDEGVFLEPGNFAYAESFDERRNTCPTLEIASFCTREVIQSAGHWGDFDLLGGVDFQSWPFNAGVSLVAVGSPADPTWYVTGCLMREGDEDFFLDDAYGLWSQDRILWIGDASGTWQDAQHTRGRASFDKFTARRWAIEPPQVKHSDRGQHPSNPKREDRINLVNSLLKRGKLIVCMDTAAPVAEALQKCEVDPKGKPRGRHAHLTDALGYPLWWATPKPGEAGGWDASDIRIVRAKPRPGSW